MSAELPESLEPWRAAARRERLDGAVSPSRLARLAGAARIRAPLSARIAVRSVEPGNPELTLEIDAELEMTCQRCLRPMTLDLRVRGRLLVAPNEQEQRALEVASETIACAPGERLDPALLVEDEVLLALPFAPRHEPRLCAPAEPTEGPPPAQDAAD